MTKSWSLLENLDGRTKLSWLVASVAVYSAQSDLLVSYLLLQSLFLLLWTKAHRTPLFKGLALQVPIVGVLVVVGYFWSGESVAVIAASLVRLSVLVLTAVTVFTVLRPFELVGALRTMAVPAGASMSLAIGLRFLPVLAEDIERVALARRARGLEGFRYNLGIAKYFLLPVLYISFERAERILFTLSVKGVAAENLVSQVNRLAGQDWVFLSVLLLEVTACVLY